MVRQTVEMLRKRVGIIYGESIPLDKITLVDWFVSRLETWGTSAGMEAFREDENGGRLTMMLGGKVVVVDINLTVDRAEPDNPKNQPHQRQNVLCRAKWIRRFYDSGIYLARRVSY